MSVLSRTEFSQFWNSLLPEKNLGESESPLWDPERYNGVECQYFIDTENITRRVESGCIPVWNEKNLRGKVLCFSSSETEEWWGFTDKKDIPLFLLRWQ